MAACGRELAQLVLVEEDETLAHVAGTTASQLGLGPARVIAGDAGTCATFAFALPVGLLMLCGIFGNVSQDDIAATIAAAPAMLRPGASVIRTRCSTDPELRCVIRQWFVDTPASRRSPFDSEPDGFGVGVVRLTQPRYPAPPQRLFTFVH